MPCFAVSDLYIDSSVGTDSFDSGDGSYSSQQNNSDSLGDYADPTGHVGSNADIDIYSSVSIRGDARPGPAGTTQVHGSSANVSGDESAPSAAVSIPTPGLVDFQNAYASNNNGEIGSSGDTSYNSTRMNLSVDGSDTLRLSGGTYFFNDFVLQSSSKLVIDGPTTIYVTGDLLLTSSVSANLSGKAADLSFICHPYNISPSWSYPSDDIELNSSLRGAFTIYAPGRDMYMDSSVELFGAVIGRAIEVNSSIQVHYDRALGGGGSGGAQTRRTYWREPSPAPTVMSVRTVSFYALLLGLLALGPLVSAQAAPPSNDEKKIREMVKDIGQPARRERVEAWLARSEEKPNESPRLVALALGRCGGSEAVLGLLSLEARFKNRIVRATLMSTVGVGLRWPLLARPAMRDTLVLTGCGSQTPRRAGARPHG